MELVRRPVGVRGFQERVYRTRGTNWSSVPLWANGEAGFAAYLDGQAHSIQVLTVDGGRVVRTSVFADLSVFEVFGLPREQAARRGPMSSGDAAGISW